MRSSQRERQQRRERERQRQRQIARAGRRRGERQQQPSIRAGASISTNTASATSAPRDRAGRHGRAQPSTARVASARSGAERRPEMTASPSAPAAAVARVVRRDAADRDQGTRGSAAGRHAAGRAPPRGPRRAWWRSGKPARTRRCRQAPPRHAAADPALVRGPAATSTVRTHCTTAEPRRGRVVGWPQEARRVRLPSISSDGGPVVAPTKELARVSRAGSERVLPHSGNRTRSDAPFAR
jgi:hypothetical protein